MLRPAGFSGVALAQRIPHPVRQRKQQQTQLDLTTLDAVPAGAFWGTRFFFLCGLTSTSTSTKS